MAEENDQSTDAEEDLVVADEADGSDDVGAGAEVSVGGGVDGDESTGGEATDGEAAKGELAKKAGSAGSAASKAGGSDGAPKKVVAKKKVVSKRVTPKGGATKGSTAAHAHSPEGHDAAGSKRYTPPSAKYQDLPSPTWVPVLMFGLLGFGALFIILNYAEVFGEPANWRLLVGLTSILGGIIAATNYR